MSRPPVRAERQLRTRFPRPRRGDRPAATTGGSIDVLAADQARPRLAGEPAIALRSELPGDADAAAYADDFAAAVAFPDGAPGDQREGLATIDHRELAARPHDGA